MMVISESDFAALTSIPRSDEAVAKGLLVDVESLGNTRKDCLVVFISHRWLRSNPKKGNPHPDSAENEKHKLITAGLRVLHRNLGETAGVYIWCDYFGIDQDDDTKKLQGIRSLPAYIERSDMLLTPIASNAIYNINEIEAIKKTSKDRGFRYVEALNFSVSYVKDLDSWYHTEEVTVSMSKFNVQRCAIAL